MGVSLLSLLQFNALEETLILYSGILSVLKILDNEQPIRLHHTLKESLVEVAAPEYTEDGAS